MGFFANRRFLTGLSLASLQTQKLALQDQTVCAANFTLREDRLPKTLLISLSRIPLNHRKDDFGQSPRGAKSGAARGLVFSRSKKEVPC